MKDPTKILTQQVRMFMTIVARSLNNVSSGKIRPSHITTLSIVGHVPVVWALYTERYLLSALLIVGFGLLDALDGALAREQNSATKQGMFYDAVSDRVKEILIYCGIALSTVVIQEWLLVAVAGTSLLVSYVKAKGEMAISSSTSDTQQLNRVFSDGIARYEVRMTLLIIGLLTNLLSLSLGIIFILNSLTAAIRFYTISKYIHELEQK